MIQMLKKQVKHMVRDATYLGVAGVGLGVMGGISPSAAPSIGTLGKGLGTAGGLVMVGHGLGMLQEIVPKKKKGYGGWY